MAELQMDSVKEYNLAPDKLRVGKGIIIKDKDGKKYKGPHIDNKNRMTIDEYLKISSVFELLSEEEKQKYESLRKKQKKEKEEDQIKQRMLVIHSPKSKNSPEKVWKIEGAEKILS